MQRVLLSSLLLFACPAWGATALDVGFVNDETVQNVTSASYVDAADTLSFTPDSTADFIIMAHAAIEVSNVDTSYSVQLNHDSGTGNGVVWEYDTDQVHGNTGSNRNNGMTWNFLDKRNLDNAAHVFSIEVKRTAGTGNVEVENVAIVALEFSAGAEYAEQLTLQDTGSDTGDVVAVTLAFTPAATKDYLLMTAAQVGHEDEASSSGSSFRLSGGEIFCDEDRAFRIGAANNEAADPDPILKSMSTGCAVIENLSNSSKTLEITIDGGGLTTEMFLQRGAIFAMPTDEFENLYSVEQLSRSGGVTGSGTWTDDVTPFGNPLEAITETLPAETHLIFLQTSSAASTDTNNGTERINLDGNAHMEMRFFHDRDEDSGDYWVNWVVYAETLVSECTSCVIKAQANCTGTAVCKYKERRLIVAEVPAAAAAARRRMNVIVGPQ